MAILNDPWPTRQAQLEAEGWLFYQVSRYDPTLVRGYTTAFLSGSAANRRKANRPAWVKLERTTANPADPWNGTMRLGTSLLNPWVTGAAMPPDDVDWAQGPAAHYDLAWNVNAAVFTELDAARDAPTATLTRQYGDCSNPDTALSAIKDLFSRISVPA